LRSSQKSFGKSLANRQSVGHFRTHQHGGELPSKRFRLFEINSVKIALFSGYVFWLYMSKIMRFFLNAFVISNDMPVSRLKSLGTTCIIVQGL
jgi:hypothetical protein